MPTYQYRCGQCGEQVDAWQSIHDDPLTAHAGCGGPLTKVFSVGGIVLKGPGFYRTDNRAKSGRENGDREPASTASDNGSAGDSKTGSDNGKKKSEPASSGASKADSSSKSGSSKSGSSNS